MPTQGFRITGANCGYGPRDELARPLTLDAGMAEQTFRGKEGWRLRCATSGDPGAGYEHNTATMRFTEFPRQSLGERRDLGMFACNVDCGIPELRNDIVLPDLRLRYFKRFVQVFFGCRGTTTPLHDDIDRGCVPRTPMAGTRRVLLLGPEASRALHRYPVTARRYMNVIEPDNSAFPALGRVHGWTGQVKPGQTLFMSNDYRREFRCADARRSQSLRAISPSISRRIQGAVNLLALCPIDRLANRLAPDGRFDWK